jgi:hypothetical protein
MACFRALSKSVLVLILFLSVDLHYRKSWSDYTYFQLKSHAEGLLRAVLFTAGFAEEKPF